MTIWRHFRRTASIVRMLLFVWLFSLAAGWVNACLLQTGSAVHGHTPSPESFAAVHHDEAVALFEQAPHDDDAGREACLRFCESEQGVVPKLELPVLGDIDATLPTPVSAWVARPACQVPARAWALAAPPPGPPLVIRLRRLTR